MNPLNPIAAPLPITGDDVIQDLISVLNAQSDTYTQMYEVVRSRFLALAAVDFDTLTELVGREQPMIAHLRRLESARTMLLRPLAARLGLGAERLTVTELCKHVSPEESKALAGARDRLVAVADRVQQANEQNRVLLEGCLDSVNDLAQSLLQVIEMNPQYGALGGAANQTGTGDPPRLADLRA